MIFLLILLSASKNLYPLPSFRFLQLFVIVHLLPLIAANRVNMLFAFEVTVTFVKNKEISNGVTNLARATMTDSVASQAKCNDV